MKVPFPKYNPLTSENTVVVVISDDTIYDEKTDKQVGTRAKTQEDANAFMVMLQGLCKTNGFQIQATGTREQMAARLFKKDVKNLITEEDCLNFAIAFFSDHFDISDYHPQIENLREFLANKP